MHDMIGTAGVVEGWSLLLHMAALWLVPTFILCITAVALLEHMVATHRLDRAASQLSLVVASLFAMGPPMRAMSHAVVQRVTTTPRFPRR